ncbi:hypothetical protein PF003_g23412 [Phytophthora fragariae]|nr:hypothetical protein PF003_g23412 [Phytophthora fragariae]
MQEAPKSSALPAAPKPPAPPATPKSPATEATTKSTAAQAAPPATPKSTATETTTQSIAAPAVMSVSSDDEEGSLFNSALEDDHETKRSNPDTSLKAAYKEIKLKKGDFEKAGREYKAAKEKLAMIEKALQQANYDEKKSQQARATDNTFVAVREAVKKRERCARLLKREEKNPSKSTASLAAAQAEFEAAKVCEEDALELKEILVRPVFAMTKDIASKGKSVNTPLYHATRQVFEEVMPAVIGFYDDK